MATTYLLKAVSVVCLEEEVQHTGDLVELLAAQQPSTDDRPILRPVGQETRQNVACIQHRNTHV
jgi:hypothetical protein